MKSISKIKDPLRRRMNQKLFAKHVLSFSLVLLCMALMVNFLFKTFLIKNLNEFNNQLQRTVLDTDVQNVFDEFKRIERLLEQAMLRKELNPTKIDKGAAEMSEAQIELRRLVRTNERVEECIIVSGKYDFAFSDLTSYRIDYFLHDIQSPLFASCTDYEDVVNVLRRHPFMPIIVRGTKMLALNLYYCHDGIPSDSYAIALMNADELLQLFNGQLDDKEKVESIIFLEDDVFLSTIPKEEEYPQLTDLQNTTTFQLGASQYRILLKDFPKSGISFAHLLDESFYSAPVQRTIYQSLVGLLIIFLIGIALITVLAYYNYKPIQSLQSVLEKHLKKKPSNKQDELNFIAHGINQLIADNVKLSDRLNVEKNQLKNFYLFKLLHSPLTDIETTKRTLKDVDIQFERECFQCLSLNLSYSGDIDIFTQRIEEERSSQSPYCNLYYLINGTNIVLIFNFFQKDIDMVQYLIENFSKYYTQEIDMSMGIGTVVHSMKELSVSYNQSQVALRYAETSKEEPLSQFDNMQLSEAIENLYNSNQVVSLLVAIRKNDLEDISQELDELKRFIQNSRIPRYAIKAIYYQIVNGILSSSHNPILFEKGNEILMAIGETLQKYTLDELHAQIESLCYQMVSQTSDVVLLDKLLDYISQHYTDVNFSIGNMVDHFGISHQSMSSLFKREMHMTIIDYITKCKISAAIELLEHTSFPISEIVKQIGYIDNSSFTRKFKSIMGITPAEYRKNFLRRE